jgi:hypothetical protein
MSQVRACRPADQRRAQSAVLPILCVRIMDVAAVVGARFAPAAMLRGRRLVDVAAVVGARFVPAPLLRRRRLVAIVEVVGGRGTLLGVVVLRGREGGLGVALPL